MLKSSLLKFIFDLSEIEETRSLTSECPAFLFWRPSTDLICIVKMYCDLLPYAAAIHSLFLFVTKRYPTVWVDLFLQMGEVMCGLPAAVVVFLWPIMF